MVRVRFGSVRTADLAARALRRQGMDVRREGNEVVVKGARTHQVDKAIKAWARRRGRLPGYVFMDW